ncbi:MAG: dihydroorotate dehydrogenase [Candidatus Njordarchaeia archaeon]
MKNKLEIKLGKIKLDNPLILASGILGNTAELLIRVAKAGAGAVTTKSIGLRENRGHPEPNIVQVECGYLNAMGLPNPGVDAFVEEIQIYKKNCKKPLIASVFGTNEDEYSQVAEKLYRAGADIIELNVSCPHSKEGIINIGWDPNTTRKIVESVKNTVSIPIFLKLPGNTNLKNLRETVEASIDAGVDGFTAINTLPAMAINIDTGVAYLGNVVGGLSGPAIKPVGVRIVYEVRKITDLPIIGVGGVKSFADVVEYMMAGANAVGIGTALVGDREIGIFKRIKGDLIKYLDEKGLGNIGELVGVVHK